MCCPFVEFLSDGRQRVVVDGAESDWFPIILGVPQGSVSCPLLFILYTSEIFELVENRLIAYADDSTLLAVVREPADRPAIAASLSRDLAKIQQWCYHWCITLNPNETKSLVVCRPRTVSPPRVDLVLSWVSIRASRLNILGVKFDSKRRRCAWYCFPCLIENWYFDVGETYICGHLCVTSLLFCICSPNPWVLFSGVLVSCWMSPSAS